jgi:hypothetical protein
MIRQPILLLLSAPVLLFTVGAFLWRADFFLNSVEATGHVVQVVARNETCTSGGKHKRRYPCTRFDAVVRYPTPRGDQTFTVGAGSSRGSSQPTTAADRSVGQRVDVRFDQRSPSSAAEDSVLGVWGAPLVGLVMQFALMFGAVMPSRDDVFGQ